MEVSKVSKLMDLMQELCPNGVETKTIGDICEICRGKVISKDFINENKGDYPVYSSQTENNGELGKISTFAFDGEYLSWTTDGANAGTVFYRNGKFNITNVCGLLKVRKRDLLIKYLYYVLNAEAPKYVNKGMGNPKLMSNVMAKITIPIPPLPVQKEIVRILDDFTKTSAELVENLDLELVARKKQYEYYRDILLSQNNSASMVSLRDVVTKSCSGATPTKGKSEFYDRGTIPWLRTQDVRFNEIYEASSFITEEAVKKTAAKWIPPNCVIVAISGATAGRCAINKIATTTNQHCLNMEIDSKKALYKYVFYCVCAKYDELISKKQGARGDLNSSLILSLSIPLPSLEKQAQIVSIIDRLDSICGKFSSTLPTEIEARQKQYEYYRDRLLTFKEVSKC